MEGQTTTPEIIITKHAIERFEERNEDVSKPSNVEKTIRKLLKKSFQIKFSGKHQVIRLLNNDIKEAVYYYSSGWIFVVSNNKIVTIERQGDKKFGKDLFRV